MSKQEIGSQLQDIINEEINNRIEEVDDVGKKVIRNGRNYIKSITPKSKKKRIKKHYVDCFTTTSYEEDGKKGYILRNKKYQLDHLLEDGHKLVVFGTVTNKRTRAFKMFEKTKEEINKEFLDGVQRIFQGGK